MTKARDLANLISTGNPLSDGAIAASEVSGLATVATSGAVADVTGAAPLASPTFTGNVSLGDNVKLKLGDGEDLQIYHDGSHSYVDDTATGTLNLRGQDNVIISRPDGSSTAAIFDTNGAVQLRYNNSTKITTTSVGADVNGGLTISGGTATQLQTSSSSVDGNIFADVQNTNTGSSSAIVQRMITSNVAGNGTTSADFQKTKAGALNINNNETNSAAIIGLSIGGGEKFRFGSSGQLGIGGATYGTSGQVLTSGGSGAAPTWADAGGGAYELIQKQTISSNVTSIDFNSISAPQQQLLLMFNGVTLDATFANVRLRFMDSSGNNIGGSNDVYQNGGRRFGFSDSGGGGQYKSFVNLTKDATIGGSANQPFNATYNIYKFGTSQPSLTGIALYPNGSNEIIGNIIASQVVGSSVANAARIHIYPYTAASNFTGGSVYLYKLV